MAADVTPGSWISAIDSRWHWLRCQSLKSSQKSSRESIKRIKSANSRIVCFLAHTNYMLTYTTHIFNSQTSSFLRVKGSRLKPYENNNLSAEVLPGRQDQVWIKCSPSLINRQPFWKWMNEKASMKLNCARHSDRNLWESVSCKYTTICRKKSFRGYQVNQLIRCTRY